MESVEHIIVFPYCDPRRFLLGSETRPGNIYRGREFSGILRLRRVGGGAADLIGGCAADPSRGAEATRRGRLPPRLPPRRGGRPDPHAPGTPPQWPARSGADAFRRVNFVINN